MLRNCYSIYKLEPLISAAHVVCMCTNRGGTLLWNEYTTREGAIEMLWFNLILLFSLSWCVKPHCIVETLKWIVFSSFGFRSMTVITVKNTIFFLGVSLHFSTQKTIINYFLRIWHVCLARAMNKSIQQILAFDINCENDRHQSTHSNRTRSSLHLNRRTRLATGTK